MDHLEIETKPRSVSFGNLDHGLFPSSTRLVPLDLKQIRQQHLLKKTLTPRIEKLPTPNTLFEINTIQEELKFHKPVTKPKKEELKLVFNKDTRPKSSLRGLDDAQQLIKIAETASSLLKSRKNGLETVKEETEKKNSVTTIFKMKSSATQRILHNQTVKGFKLPSNKSFLNLKKPAKK